MVRTLPLLLIVLYNTFYYVNIWKCTELRSVHELHFNNFCNLLEFIKHILNLKLWINLNFIKPFTKIQTDPFLYFKKILPCKKYPPLYSLISFSTHMPWDSLEELTVFAACPDSQQIWALEDQRGVEKEGSPRPDPGPSFRRLFPFKTAVKRSTLHNFNCHTIEHIPLVLHYMKINIAYIYIFLSKYTPCSQYFSIL